MSKRRVAGDVVYKRPGAGFCGQGAVVKLLPEEPEYEMPCTLGCGDDACREWSNTVTLDGKAYFYHVSECEMEEADKSTDGGER